jgi:hypothetical protein
MWIKHEKANFLKENIISGLLSAGILITIEDSSFGRIHIDSQK